MRIESLICLLNQPFVERSLATAGLVSGHEQNCRATGIECECNAPHATVRIEPQFLQVRVLGSVESVDAWATKRRPKLCQQFQLCEQLILNSFGKFIEL